MGATGTLGQRLARFWRQCGTAIAFVLFGIGGLVLSLVVFPMINLVFRDKKKRAAVAQRVVHFTWKIFVDILVGLRVIDFQTEGSQLLRGDAGTLVIANHPSLLDVVLIMSLMDRTQCVVKADVWNNPFMKGVVRATNYIPNLGDSGRTLDDCVAALQAGNNLVIFPEGSRSVPGEKLRLERGFANIAVRGGVPIRLVTVSCRPPILRKGDPWYWSPLRRPCFRVHVHERIEAATICDPAVPSRAARDVTAHVTRRFEELLANECA